MGKVTNLAEKRATPKPNFMDTLKATAKPKETTTTKKSSVPVLAAPPEVQEAVDEYIDAKEREKIAKAEMDSAGETIIAFVRPIQDQDGWKRTYRNSYAVPGTKPENKVKFVTKNMFKINAEDSGKIAEILGENFDNLMDRKYDVVLKADVFENQEKQQRLMELVGDAWGEFFETSEKLKVRDGFDERVFEVLDEEGMAKLRVFCQQYKASLM
jgi:hypothetical protein